MKKRGLLQHADGSDFFGFHITSTVPRLGEMVDSILSLISGEVRGERGKGRSIAVVLYGMSQHLKI